MERLCTEWDSLATPFRRRRFGEAVSAMAVLAIKWLEGMTLDGSAFYVLFETFLGLAFRLRFRF